MHIVPSRARLSLLTLLVAGVLAPVASAQDTQDPPPNVRQPIGRFAADVRGAMPRFKQTAPLADSIGVPTTALPSRGLGLVLGAHVYPFRIGQVTVGLGGEVLTSRGSKTEDPQDEAAPDGPTVRTRFSAVSPQLSLNFGARDGWSYVSGGLAWTRFSVELEEAGTGTPSADPELAPRQRTIHYGGGARWFAKKHVAVSFDLRLYSVIPQPATATSPELPRMTVMVFSLGAGFR